ncbi:hypothetical protein GCM10011331_01720 [Flavimobilis marinus]|uniref:AAA+ ATPase domain-containing protein n=1 Tax=Flavimobilis marinus TaxID=285351 RepID=A0A1I2E147_9MICO|nr:bifunctional RecB family nuclease/DEAD/DEAH box helicase [Flavimobilis marinus]GHG43852.1 hypothetical protein GCM10011331_01720 [Flavimobilis marinus]SFE86387.1 uncharacterized protein SAMN04488035_0836 [Flavimobilis marinus]
MLLTDDDTLVYSATDLASAASCEFALLRALDGRLGRVDPVVLPVDAMLERAARLGDAHEQRVLEDYLARFGPWDRASGTGVACIERPAGASGRRRDALERKHAQTLDVLRAGADVVFQAGFFDGRFGGWADFLVRMPGSGEPGSAAADGVPTYAVYDTKLARHAKVTALLQVTAYADQLLRAGIRPADQVHLVLGDRSTVSHELRDLLPVYRERRAALEGLLDRHRAADAPVVWGEPSVRACGRCAVCAPEVESHRDVLLVAGLRSTQRARLLAAGITTIDQLAASRVPVDGVGAATLEALRLQAALQVEQDPPGSEVGGGEAVAAESDAVSSQTTTGVVFRVVDAAPIHGLPAPDPGDVFFDFEGDPLWSEDASADWGLEYLFGLVEAPQEPTAQPVFRTFWAHDRAQEKQALLDFLAYVTQRRAAHPGMHVYHYAPYEKTALLRLAGRHGVGEQEVDDLLRAGVLVDLYATVRRSVRTGQRSYSIKKLEPLYMEAARAGEVTTAGDSIVEYADACALRDGGDTAAWAERLEAIARYNEDDCVSTLRLRDWLLQVAGAPPDDAAGTAPGAPPSTATPGPDALMPAPEPDLDAEAESEPDPLADQLAAFAGAEPRGVDQQAVALLAASLDYHRREDKPFWWAHFDRLVSDPADWTEPRSTFVVEPGSAEVLEPWHVPPGKRTKVRRLRLAGRLEPGSELRAGAAAWSLYDVPVPGAAKTTVDGVRGWFETATVTQVDVEEVDGAVRDVLIVDERLPSKAEAHDALPMALGPGAPPRTDKLVAAVRDVAQHVAASLPALPPHPAVDLLRRIPPRTRSGAPLPSVGAGNDAYADAIVAALGDLDGSYLAVQGPPGTGKTHTGAHVVAQLVRRGWRIGVVAQSHAVVEHMLDGIASAGVPQEQLGKRPASDRRDDVPWQWLGDTGFGPFYAAQRGGYVVGGTMWDFTNVRRLPDQAFDLLVVDEAGQFSLANTIAVSGAARSLLLLGDPQQLPQVSQGRHPEPVDRSALGWLADGHDTLPAELGYFLARTWRMHPALAGAVSRLSYDGRLEAMACTSERSLDGVAPGVTCRRVHHDGNAVASREEARAVAEEVRSVLGRRWRDPATSVDRPLRESDVIVVAPYNAQVWTVRQELAAAGLGAVRVGTVDKFQGQQAVVVVLSMAASSADDVPRGMEFLLNRNRLNVAISRGQWRAVVVRGEHLTDYLPTRPEQLGELGAFIAVCERCESGRATGGPTA